MKKLHLVENITFKDGFLNLVVDDKPHQYKLQNISDSLAGASQDELECFEVSPSGYGIHWPLLDEDISIDGLLGVKHSPLSGLKTA